MRTQAQKFADRLGNVGEQWEDMNGISFDDVLTEMRADTRYSRRQYDLPATNIYSEGCLADHTSGDPVRHVFEDNSAVVEAFGAWDIEGSTPFAWESSE